MIRVRLMVQKGAGLAVPLFPRFSCTMRALWARSLLLGHGANEFGPIIVEYGIELSEVCAAFVWPHSLKLTDGPLTWNLKFQISFGKGVRHSSN